MALNLGFSIGPALGGFFAAVSYHLLFYGNAFSSAVAGTVFYFYFRKKEKDRISADALRKNTGTQLPGRSPWQDRKFVVFLAFWEYSTVSSFSIADHPSFVLQGSLQVERLGYRAVAGLQRPGGIYFGDVHCIHRRTAFDHPEDNRSRFIILCFFFSCPDSRKTFAHFVFRHIPSFPFRNPDDAVHGDRGCQPCYPWKRGGVYGVEFSFFFIRAYYIADSGYGHSDKIWF